MTDFYDRIVTAPDVLDGVPHIAGTSISVQAVVILWISGFSHAEILADYPELTPADIDQAIAFDGATEQF